MTLEKGTIVEAQKHDGGFRVRTDDGRGWRAKVLLLCTGLVDILPDISGFDDFYGVSIHSCPYCDGWEIQGQRVGVVGSDEMAAEPARELQIWSGRITLFTNQPKGTPPAPLPRGSRFRVVEGTISRLHGTAPRLEALEIGPALFPCESLFFSPRQEQHSDLAVALGCDLVDEEVPTPRNGSICVEGVFVAGNASCGLQMAIVAAAEGAQAAAAINDWLIDHE